MRTTVILDADAERALRQESARTGKTHKEILNDSLRQILITPKKGRNQPFVQPTYHLGQSRVDLTKAQALAADLEDQESIDKLARDA